MTQDHKTLIPLEVKEKPVPFNEESPVMYVLEAKPQGVVSFEKLAVSIIQNMGLNARLAECFVGMLSDAIKVYVSMGHAVSLDHIGTLKPVINARAHTRPEDCSVDDVQRVKYRFYPTKELRTLLDHAHFRIE